MLEFAEIKYVGFWNYINDGWNFSDYSQIIAFSLHILIQYYLTGLD
jgi:hypothetical protein